VFSGSIGEDSGVFFKSQPRSAKTQKTNAMNKYLGGKKCASSRDKSKTDEFTPRTPNDTRRANLISIKSIREKS